jgi:hypothetical protein
MYPSITSKVNKHLSKSFIKYFLYRTDFVWFPLSNTSRNMFGMSIVIYFILNIGFSDAFPSSMITWHTENPVYGLVDYSRNLFVDISFRFCWLFSLHSSLILLEKSINLSSVYILGFVFRSCSEWGPSWSWSWSYGSWIYNYLYNQYLSPLKLWVRILLMARCTWYNIIVCQWLVTGQWFSRGTLVSSTNKTDHHNITEILLKVTLNTITKTPVLNVWSFLKTFF